jgi:hypothetical protein
VGPLHAAGVQGLVLDAGEGVGAMAAQVVHRVDGIESGHTIIAERQVDGGCGCPGLG